MSPTIQVLKQASHALKTSVHPALRRLSLEEATDSIIIKGQVGSYFLKQMAQETVMPIRGRLHLINSVDVIGK